MKNLVRLPGVVGYEPGFNSGYRVLSSNLDINRGFEANFFELLYELEAGNFWFRSRNRLIIWALQQYFPKAQSFLEVGCGTGYVLSGIARSLPHLKLHGSEIFSDGLAFAAKRLPTVELFQMDARHIPFQEEYDVIGAFDVLEHIQEDGKVLQEMHRAIRPGGGLLLTVPQHPWLWSQADSYAHHVRRYRSQDLSQAIEQAGFSIVKMTSFVSLLLPLMLLSRLRQRQPDPNYDPTAEFKISDWMNAALENVLTMELQFIRAGVSFPFGGSLLVVASKP